MTKQLKKQIQNQAQQGRSMIEMLGVLAIIAILSIGGIVGYKLAMNYYQADQIANEINLMRNDLKVKYALGNEELLLGDPYDETPDDENYSGHLSTQYDRYPVDYDCIRKDKAEFYNCRETDAYYIKVGNVAKGVCKPLTTLVNAMDGLMYMEINKEVYEKYDLCTSDEANEFYIQFDAEEVNGNYDSNRPEGWCGDDDDCEGLSTPVCDKESNTCVECVKEGDCSAPRFCDVANHECVECIENADCPTNKPVCNIDLGDCESCPPEKPIWYNNTCVECTVNEDCLEKGTDKPICNSDTNTCEACPEDQPWNGEFCGCLSNNDCESDEFCLTSDCYCICGDDPDAYRSGTTTEQDCCTDKPHKCVKVSEYTAPNLDSNDSPYIMSNHGMNWWSAERFCQALSGSKHMLKISDLECCNDSLGGITQGRCSAKGDRCSNANGFSHVIKALSRAETGSEEQGNNYYWLEDPYTEANKGRNSCGAYVVKIIFNEVYGSVGGQNRGNYHGSSGKQHHALCW